MSNEKHPKYPPPPRDRDREIGKRDSPDWDRGSYNPPVEKIDAPERWPRPEPKDKK